MRKSIFKLLLAHVQNIFITMIWSPLVIIPFLVLFATEMNDFFWNALLVCWIVQGFVSLFVHAIFLIPSYFWQNQDENIEEIYKGAYPILLIPIATYLCITIGIFHREEESFQMILFAMFGFISIYSISLYTLLQKITKPISHEKID